MDRIEKAALLSLKKADAAADIELINQYAQKELTPDGVFCFSIHLCDNDIDRDVESFTADSIEKLAPLFVGKPGLLNHSRMVEKQVARLYRVEAQDGKGKTKFGAPMKVLRGDAYIPRTETTTPFIESIEAGIIKEVSVGCRMGTRTCSICGKAMYLDWRNWRWECEDGHVKGEKYEKKLCFAELSDPEEAYEFSFTPVPAQRSAGVVKSDLSDVEVFERLKGIDLSKHVETVRAILPLFQSALTVQSELDRRKQILQENEKYLKSN